MRAAGAQGIEEGAATGHEVGDAHDRLLQGSVDAAEVALDPGAHGVGRDDTALGDVDAEDALEDGPFGRREALHDVG